MKILNSALLALIPGLICLLGTNSLLVHSSLADQQSPSLRANWCAIMPYQVFNEYHASYAFPVTKWTPERAHALQVPTILFEGSDRMVPIGGGHGLPSPYDYDTILHPNSLGLVAIETDSSWTEEQGDAGVVHLVPEIIVVDTTGAERVRFLGARNPRWSPDWAQLALERVRQPMGPKVLGRTMEYRESPDSVLIWNVATGLTRAFPIAAQDLGWDGPSQLIADCGYVAVMIELKSGRFDGFPNPRGVQRSPDRQYAARIATTPTGQPNVFRLWHHGTELTERLLKEAAGAPQQRPLPFWIKSKDGHTLCFGVNTGKKQPGPPYKKLVWRTVFIDVARMKVVRSFDARLVAPIADYSGAVVRRGDRFVFVRPSE